MAVLLSVSSPVFCVDAITREPLHLAWCNCAYCKHLRVCGLRSSVVWLYFQQDVWPICSLNPHLRISRSKVKVTWVLCVSGVRGTAWTSRPGFTRCHSLDGATSYLIIRLSAEVTGVTRGQYSALSKAWRSRCILFFMYIRVADERSQPLLTMAGVFDVWKSKEVR